VAGRSSEFIRTQFSVIGLSFNGQSWVCCCTRVERWVFDSLVLSPCTTGFVRLRPFGLYGVMKSEADFKM
jgi:hypothetical protein